MEEFTTWIFEKDGKVARVRQFFGDKSPGPGWRQVPNNWLDSSSGGHQGGNPGDDLSWFDDDGYRMTDAELIEKEKLQDNRGRWHHKEKIGETIQVNRLGEPSPGDDWTKEEPLKNEPYQKWDPKKKKYIVDEEKKKIAKKEQLIAEKKSAIQTAEQGILRSLIVKQRGKATQEDEQVFEKFASEIETLRNEMKEMQE